MNARRALIDPVSLIILGGLAVVFLAPKVVPSLFDKRTKEAHASADASAQVELAVSNERAGRLHADGIIAASLAQMNMAWGQLGESPQKTFLDREYQYVAPLLGAPDVAAMQASYERRIAIEQGKTELADKLYRDANGKNAELLVKNAKLEARLESSFAGRREVDGRLAESAAFARGKDLVIGIVALIAMLAIGGWLYLRFWMGGNTVGLDSLAHARAMIMKGEKSVEDAFDGIVDRKHWGKVATLVDAHFTAKDHKPKT